MHQEDSTVRHTPFLFVVCAQDAVLNMSLLHVSCLHAQQGKGRQDGRMNHESTATEVRFSLRLSSAHDDGTHIRNEHKNRGNGLACFRQNEVQSQKHREVRTNSCRTAEGQSTRHLKTQIRRTNSYRLDVVRPHQLQQAVFSLWEIRTVESTRGARSLCHKHYHWSRTKRSKNMTVAYNLRARQ